MLWSGTLSPRIREYKNPVGRGQWKDWVVVSQDTTWWRWPLRQTCLGKTLLPPRSAPRYRDTPPSQRRPLVHGRQTMFTGGTRNDTRDAAPEICIWEPEGFRQDAFLTGRAFTCMYYRRHACSLESALGSPVISCSCLHTTTTWSPGSVIYPVRGIPPD